MGNCLTDKDELQKEKVQALRTGPPTIEKPAPPEKAPATNTQPLRLKANSAPSGSAPANKTAAVAPPPTAPVREGDVELTRVFGCTIELSSEHSGGGVPAPIKEACRWLMIHGLDHEGLFRIPGRALSVKAWIEEFNYNPTTVFPENENVDNVTSFVINYFKQLKNDSGGKGFIWQSPDGAYNMQNEVQALRKLKKKADLHWVKDALSNLSPVQVGIFRDLTAVLRAASTEEMKPINRMNPYNFSMCTMPTVMAAVEIMITEHDFVFGEAESNSTGGTSREVDSPKAELAAAMSGMDGSRRPTAVLESIGEAQAAVSQEK